MSKTTKGCVPDEPDDPSGSMWLDASTERFEMCYFDPPSDLKRDILTLYHFKTDELQLEDRHPGALAQLVLIFEGSGELHLPGQVQALKPGAYMFCGFDVGAPFRLHGRWHSVGASLSHKGWAALTGVAANESLNRVFPASDLIGADIASFMEAIHAKFRAGEASDAEIARALARWIAPRLNPISSDHQILIEQTIAWLSKSLYPDVELLVRDSAYSRRQTERLVARYFGYTPSALARKLRAVRAADLLAQSDLTDQAEAEMAEAFYDQPHMIREIRRFCGYTPTRLGGSEEPVFRTMLGLPNLDKLEQYRRIG